MREIIRLTETDLHQIIKESLNQYMIQEGFGSKLRNGIAGAALALSPMNAQAQTPVQNNQFEQQSALEKQDIMAIFEEIEKNTRENLPEIQDIEAHMKEDSEIADIIYNLAVMDEMDNFITVDKKGIQTMTQDAYNAMIQKSETDVLIKITYIDGETIIPNVIVPLDELETALENY